MSNALISFRDFYLAEKAKKKETAKASVKRGKADILNKDKQAADQKATKSATVTATGQTPSTVTVGGGA